MAILQSMQEELSDIRAKLDEIVAELNENITELTTWGPHSKYEIEGARGRLELTIDVGMEGIACSMDSDGHRALMAATEATLGEVKPYSIGGSLPLVRDLPLELFAKGIIVVGATVHFAVVSVGGLRAAQHPFGQARGGSHGTRRGGAAAPTEFGSRIVFRYHSAYGFS